MVAGNRAPAKAVSTESTNAAASAIAAPSALPNLAANAVTVNTAKILNTGTKASKGQLNSALPKLPAGLTKATSNLLNHGK